MFIKHDVSEAGSAYFFR